MATVKVNEIQLNTKSIRIDDPASETILLFLHEALGSIPQWRSFPESLCTALKMNGLVYERQGHGSSSPFTSSRTARYLHQYAYDELPSFLDAAISPEQKIILIGHSDGGSIALLYAAAFPKRVSACITMAAHVINEPETISGIGPAVTAFKEGKLNKLKDYHGDKTEALFYAWADTWNSEAFMNWDICGDLKGLTAPILAIQGKKDQYGTSRQLQLIQSSVGGPCETEMLDSCGHHPHLERSSDVIMLINEFIQRIDL